MSHKVLLLDVGNTRVKWCYLQRGKLSEGHAFVRENHRFDHQLRGINANGVTHIWVSSVAQTQVKTSLSEWARSHGLGEPQFLVSPVQGHGLSNGYRQPNQLGIDRWLAMVGAWSLGQHAWLVVDAGTALTLDAISPKGQHIGGLITPGLQLMQHSLLAQTSQIQLQDHSDSVDWGATTTQAVDSGGLLALAALIDRQYAQLKSDWPDLECVFTGGDCVAISQQMNTKVLSQGDLVFRGLRCYAEQAS